MKHTIQTLKKNLTLAEVEALETELRKKLRRDRLMSHGYCPVWDNAYDFAIKEFLGK